MLPIKPCPPGATLNWAKTPDGVLRASRPDPPADAIRSRRPSGLPPLQQERLLEILRRSIPQSFAVDDVVRPVRLDKPSDQPDDLGQLPHILSAWVGGFSLRRGDEGTPDGVEPTIGICAGHAASGSHPRPGIPNLSFVL